MLPVRSRIAPARSQVANGLLALGEAVEVAHAARSVLAGLRAAWRCSRLAEYSLDPRADATIRAIGRFARPLSPLRRQS